jgi:hypothetical protein
LTDIQTTKPVEDRLCWWWRLSFPLVLSLLLVLLLGFGGFLPPNDPQPEPGAGDPSQEIAAGGNTGKAMSQHRHSILSHRLSSLMAQVITSERRAPRHGAYRPVSG